MGNTTENNSGKREAFCEKIIQGGKIRGQFSSLNQKIKVYFDLERELQKGDQGKCLTRLDFACCPSCTQIIQITNELKENEVNSLFITPITFTP